MSINKTAKKHSNGRPERGDYEKVGGYIEARDAWKERNPNLHTVEEERKHLADMEVLRARPERTNLVISGKDYKRLVSHYGQELEGLKTVVVSAPLSNGTHFLGIDRKGHVAEVVARLGIKEVALPSGAPPARPMPAKAKETPRKASPASPNAR